MDDKYNGTIYECSTASESDVTVEYVGPFAVTPEGGVMNCVEFDLAFPSGVVSIARPSAKILLHPIMRNYWSIAIVEQATGRTAVIRNGYIELVKV